MSAPITLVVPMPPNIANGSHGHWSKRHREKGEYWLHLDVIRQRRRLAPFYEIPPAPYAPIERASIRSVMYLGRAMDDSNAMRRHKWVEDWLVTRKYLKDDRRACLKWEAFPEQVVRRNAPYRIEITLTPLSPSTP